MTVIKIIILKKDCGGVISQKEGWNTRFYLRKQRSCFSKAKHGASFLRPTGCTNCESLFGGYFEAEICIEIRLETQEPLFDLVNLETENVCPYEMSSTRFSNLDDTCQVFFAHKVPHFKITTISNGQQVSRYYGQHDSIREPKRKYICLTLKKQLM